MAAPPHSKQKNKNGTRKIVQFPTPCNLHSCERAYAEQKQRLHFVLVIFVLFEFIFFSFLSIILNSVDKCINEYGVEYLFSFAVGNWTFVACETTHISNCETRTRDLQISLMETYAATLLRSPVNDRTPIDNKWIKSLNRPIFMEPNYLDSKHRISTIDHFMHCPAKVFKWHFVCPAVTMRWAINKI